jgi:hypothetical protein
MSFTKRGRPPKARYQVQGLEELNKTFAELKDLVATPKEVQQILTAGAAPMVAQAKKYIKKSKEDHYYYYKAKGRKSLIKSGNLQKSIRFFRQRNGNVSIGNRVGKAEKVMGDSTKTASGYYAAALYKSAVNFRRQVTEKAVAASFKKGLLKMEQRVSKILKKYQ